MDGAGRSRWSPRCPQTACLYSTEVIDLSGGHSGGETPVPIPNTAVKPAAPMVLGQRPGE